MKNETLGKGLSFTVVLSIYAVLSTLAMALRIWGRHIIKGVGLDDYLMIAGWVIFVFVIVFDFISINYGLGARAYRLTPDDVQQAKKWFLFASMAYAIATSVVKASICVLLLRVTRGTKRLYIVIIYGVIILTCAGCLARLIGYVTRCKPFSDSWKPSGNCRSPSILSGVTWFFSAVCITTDWVCSILPIFIIWNLSLPLRTKIYLGFVLALAIFASVATIIRMKHLIDYTTTTDALYSLMDVGLWSETEVCIGIIAGSLPTMRPLFRYLPHLKSNSRDNPKSINTSSYQLDSFSLRCMSTKKGSSRRSTKHEVIRDEKCLGHSFHITSGGDMGLDNEGDREVDLERGHDEAGSERDILRELRMDIVKETQFEVWSENGSTRSVTPMRSSESTSGDIGEQRLSRVEEKKVLPPF